MYEVAELIRRGAPLYLKFGLAKAPGIYPYGHHLRDLTLAGAKERVRRGRLALDLLARHGADADMARSAAGCPARSTGSRSRHNVPETPFTKGHTTAHNPTHLVSVLSGTRQG